MLLPAASSLGATDGGCRNAEHFRGRLARCNSVACRQLQMTSRLGHSIRISKKHRHLNRCMASAEPEVKGQELENPDSEQARKKAEVDRLRAAEKFMVIGTGEATCSGCGYEYSPKRGDPEYPVAPGVFFENLPADWNCPICGAPREKFNSRAFEVAGFAENQKYGLGTNSMTSGQKSILIFGSLFFFFLLFLAGYFID